MIKVILWDIDGTLLNFLKAEHAAICRCFEIFQLGICTDEMIARYSKINRKYWERLERGEISKQEVLEGRFREFFAGEKLPTDCVADFNEEYQVRLGDTVFFNDDGYELVKELRSKVRQYAVTNGTKVAQTRKLSASGLGELFDGVFISDEIGVEKPGVGFFDYVWSRIGAYNRDEVMIVGDSLTSDMQGGNNAGILCCWYNPDRLPNKKGVRVDYEITNLKQLPELLYRIADTRD